jgi:hypothetical protein
MMLLRHDYGLPNVKTFEKVTHHVIPAKAGIQN